MIYEAHGKFKDDGAPFQFSCNTEEFFRIGEKKELLVNTRRVNSDMQGLQNDEYVDWKSIDTESLRPDIKQYFEISPIKSSATRVTYFCQNGGEMLELYSALGDMAAFNLHNIFKGTLAPDGDTAMIGFYQTIHDAWIRYESDVKDSLTAASKDLAGAAVALGTLGNTLDLMQSDCGVICDYISGWKSEHADDGMQVANQIKAAQDAKAVILLMAERIKTAWKDINCPPVRFRPLTDIFRDVPVVRRVMEKTEEKKPARSRRGRKRKSEG